MRLTVKKTAILFGLLLILGTSTAYVWWVYFNYRFTEITENKVYKSGRIPPDKIADFINRHDIKTVIDLLHPGVQDKLNPDVQASIDQEKAAIAKLENIRHINIPSHQVPNRQNLVEFFNILDNDSTYPVLIHCYHGLGRAHMYSALYRIEYENFSNEKARAKTRTIVYGSSF
jgi:protein tyrosine/serine phosphatase